jgi:hypothetical protein
LQGLQGVPGPAGPAGPAASSLSESPFAIVDQNGQEVGVATDVFNGILYRRVGNDAIVFFASAAGPSTVPLDFYHATADCSDSRYVALQGGSGLAYFASVRGGTFFYTRTTDPAVAPQVPILAFEHFEVTDDATLPGICRPMAMGTAPLGVLTTATDPALANLSLPLRLK